jgi:nucleoside-diphosphate-sugar epimerase
MVFNQFSIRVLPNIRQHPYSESYNVGGSGYCSILEVVEKIIHLTGNTFEPKIEDKDFVEIKEQYLDSTKIESLGWQCKHKIDAGLAKSVEWYKEYRDKVKLFKEDTR